MRFPPILNRTHFERSGYLEVVSAPRRHDSQLRGSERAHRELLQAVEAGRRLERGLPGGARSCSRRRPAIRCIRCSPARCRPSGRLVDVMSYCFRHEPSDDAGRMQMFRMHEHVRAAEPETVMAWREMWLGRVEWLVDNARPRGARGRGVRSVLRPRRHTARRRASAISRLKLEIVAPIASDERPTAIISLNYHQDHFGALFGITTADGARRAHLVRRVRPRADDAGALPPPRLRPRAMDVTGTRGARPVMRSRSGRSTPATYTPPCRFTSSDRAWPESNCYVDLWVELLPRPRSEPLAALPFTFARGRRRRPVDVLQVPARRPLRAVRRRGHRAERLAFARRSLEEQLALGRPAIVEVDAFLSSRHRGHELSHRARQDVDRRPGARCVRAPARLLPQRRLLRACRGPTSQACSVSRTLTGPEYLPPYVEVAKLAVAACTDRPRARRRVARAASAPTSPGDRHDNPFRRYAARFASRSRRAGRRTARAVSPLCVRHVPAVRRRVRARRRLSPLAPGERRGRARAESRRPAISSPRPPRRSSSGPLASSTHRVASIRRRCSRRWPSAWDETMTGLAARYGALANHG